MEDEREEEMYQEKKEIEDRNVRWNREQ